MSGNNTPLLTVRNQHIPGELLMLTVVLVASVLTIASSSIGIASLDGKITKDETKQSRKTFLGVMVAVSVLLLLFVLFRFYMHKAKRS